MTITADAPVSPAGSTLAPYTAANGDIVLPGCYGVSHGSGITGELIRHATESWAGHAFVYVGNGQIIEAEPPAARVSAARTLTRCSARITGGCARPWSPTPTRMPASTSKQA